MATFRFGFRLLAALTLLGSLTSMGQAAGVSVEQVLAYKPKQPGVEFTIPPSAEVPNCTVELEKGAVLANGKQATAWVLKDGKGNVLRKFHDTTGAGGVNMFSYYRDGEEAYREVDTNGNGKIDQYRWLGPNGSKWGVDTDEDGKIDGWVVITPEEVSQELLAAVIAKDQKRLEALMLTPAELTGLGLPKAETERLKTKLGLATATFQKTCNELKDLSDKSVWVQLQARQPQTTPADVLGSKADLVRYKHAALLCQDGEGMGAKLNWLQTGEMIQVGRAWRIVQGPIPGMQPVIDDGTEAGGPGLKPPSGPEGERLMKELTDLDQKGPGADPTPAQLREFNLKRAAIVEQMVLLFKTADQRDSRDKWLRQAAEGWAAAAQQGDKTAVGNLARWREALSKDPASKATLAYVAFREMTSEYAQNLPNIDKEPEKLNKLQEGWKEKLARFVADHPKADDTPDAIMQLGMVNEFFGSRAEGDAKAAYALLVKNFPTHALAKRAQGCLDRLTLEGKELDLSAPPLDGGAAFDVKTLQGKAAVVYYWASWNSLAAADFGKINLALKDYQGKAELVGVNLDGKAADAQAFLKVNPAPGTHLHMPGGLDSSPLAVRYGITALPVMFLVGPDGKVVTRHVQAATLDDELRKIFKPAAPSKDKEPGKDK